MYFDLLLSRIEEMNENDSVIYVLWYGKVTTKK